MARSMWSKRATRARHASSSPAAAARAISPGSCWAASMSGTLGVRGPQLGAAEEAVADQLELALVLRALDGGELDLRLVRLLHEESGELSVLHVEHACLRRARGRVEGDAPRGGAPAHRADAIYACPIFGARPRVPESSRGARHR